jgi:hypothetical protein
VATNMPPQTFTFDVADAKIWPLESDTIGAAPTYGTGIDVPGVNNVTVAPEFISAVLKGDSKTLARRARIDAFGFSCGYSLLSIDVLGALWNATVTEPATTSDAQVLEVQGGGHLPYFGFGFQILDAEVGIGSINVYGLKVQVTGGNIFDQATDAFGGRSFQCAAIPTFSDNKMFRVKVHPTPTALSLT